MHGIYGENLETDIDFILNNDFTLNQWKFFPTQAKIEFGLSDRLAYFPDRQSKIVLGRQLYAEGFDLFLLDGIRTPVYWSKNGGVSLQLGSIKSMDMDSDLNTNVLYSGLSLWENILGYQIRSGISARENGLASQFGFFSVSKSFNDFIFSPQILNRQEFNLNSSSFNQSATDLTLNLNEKWTLYLNHAYLNPRPIERRQMNNFVYRLLSVSPQESLTADLHFQKDKRLALLFSAQSFSYLANLKKEYGDKQEISTQIQFDEMYSVDFVVTNLLSYGGVLQDIGTRLIYSMDEKRQLSFDVDAGYLRKINGISGYVSHVRSSYQTTLGSRVTGLFGVEAERNQYFEFDLRAMAYVTSYL